MVWGAIDFKITQDARQCPVEVPAELSPRQAGRGGEKGGWEHALSSAGVGVVLLNLVTESPKKGLKLDKFNKSICT